MKDKDLWFTMLWHHVYDVARLREVYLGLKRRSAPGVDGETWQQYGQNLEANLQDLSGRLRRGTYRARPVLRVYIPKSDAVPLNSGDLCGGLPATGVPTATSSRK